MHTNETKDAAAAPPRQNHDALLDAVIGNLGCKNDAALARALELAPPVISKLRHHKLAVTPATILRIYDQTGMSIEDIRAYLAQPLQ